MIATTGGRNTTALRERFAAENVLIEDFVGFDLLFDHARMFICNGGYGSILQALSKGVPVLSAGTREGKNDINARIDYFGVGVDLRTERPAAKKIGAGVERILRDRSVAANVARLRAEFEAYEPLELINRQLVA